MPVSTLPLEDTVRVLASWVEATDRPRTLSCINSYSFEEARRNPALRNAIASADLVIPDGIGVVLVSKLTGGSVRSRVCGPDVFMALSAVLNERPRTSVFFLGSSDEVLSNIEANYSRDFPRITIAGRYSPPYSPRFDDAELRVIRERINAVSPDVVWVGLGSPKQEIWTEANRHDLTVRLICPVGAMFDFYSGRIPRAPAWMQRGGMEWLYRFAKEPRRMGKRLLDQPPFLIRGTFDRILTRAIGSRSHSITGDQRKSRSRVNADAKPQG